MENKVLDETFNLLETLKKSLEKAKKDLSFMEKYDLPEDIIDHQNKLIFSIENAISDFMSIFPFVVSVTDTSLETPCDMLYFSSKEEAINFIRYHLGEHKTYVLSVNENGIHKDIALYGIRPNKDLMVDYTPTKPSFIIEQWTLFVDAQYHDINGDLEELIEKCLTYPYHTPTIYFDHDVFFEAITSDDIASLQERFNSIEPKMVHKLFDDRDIYVIEWYQIVEIEDWHDRDDYFGFYDLFPKKIISPNPFKGRKK